MWKKLGPGYSGVGEPGRAYGYADRATVAPNCAAAMLAGAAWVGNRPARHTDAVMAGGSAAGQLASWAAGQAGGLALSSLQWLVLSSVPPFLPSSPCPAGPWWRQAGCAGCPRGGRPAAGTERGALAGATHAHVCGYAGASALCSGSFGVGVALPTHAPAGAPVRQVGDLVTHGGLQRLRGPLCAAVRVCTCDATVAGPVGRAHAAAGEDSPSSSCLGRLP